MSIRQFIKENYFHFNAGELKRAIEALEIQIKSKNKIFLTLSGAMSTARIGRLLAPAIEKGLIGAICCTGANLEEDVFNAIEGHRYKQVHWRGLSSGDEEFLVKSGWNRVTDTCIPENVMRHVWKVLLESWNLDLKLSPYEHMRRALDKIVESETNISRLDESWVWAAHQANIPVFVPGWSDSTTGNMFTASVKNGDIRHRYESVISDAEQFELLANWYEDTTQNKYHGPAFLQIGGGIAGDWPICVVPSLRQDENKDVPHWGYFCQIGDAPASYGGYSGAPPNEKITWDKISSQTPRFAIQSDATIVLPLILSYLLETEDNNSNETST
jgi:deoxyhypusine synthase